LGNRLPAHLAELEVVREHLGYLWKRETLMHNTTFRQMGGRLVRAWWKVPTNAWSKLV
jgi:hypothetical protein